MQEDTELMRLNNAEMRISVKNDSKKNRKKFTISRVDGRWALSNFSRLSWLHSILFCFYFLSRRALGMGQGRDIEVIYDGKDGKEVGEIWEAKFREGGIQIENFGSAHTLVSDYCLGKKQSKTRLLTSLYEAISA